MNSAVTGIGQRIRTIRAGVSQVQFSKLFDVPVSALRRYEKENDFPDAEFIGKICIKYNIDPMWLLFGEHYGVGPGYYIDHRVPEYRGLMEDLEDLDHRVDYIKRKISIIQTSVNMGKASGKYGQLKAGQDLEEKP